MAFRTMYPPQKDSPSTFLLGDISAVDTLMTVASAAALPQTLPYPLTIGIDKNLTETVMVIAQNLGNNQLTITRGTPAYAWVAGSKAARVLRSEDLEDIQTNIRTLGSEMTVVDENIQELNITVEANTEAIGDSTSGLIKTVNDEISRAIAADAAETSRADTEEKRIDAAKPDRTELPQVITDWTYSADGTKVRATITRYNASTKQTSTYTRDIPIVDNDSMGVMTPEAYNEITNLRNDVNALINQGGRFIGVSFATKANLDAYTTPASVKSSDYTYVLDDETKSGATTRYVWNGTVWNFAFIVESDPVGLATSTSPGLVKSDSGSTNGKVFVETDGTMSVVGWDAISSKANAAATVTQMNESEQRSKTYADEQIAAENTEIYNYIKTNALNAIWHPTVTTSGTTKDINIGSYPYNVNGAKVSFILESNVEATTITINSKAVKKEGSGEAITLLEASKLYTVWYDVTNSRFLLQIVDAEKEPKFTLRITFDAKFAVGTTFSVVGGSLNYVGTVPASRVADVAAEDANTTYVVTCGTSTKDIVVENLYGIFEAYMVRTFINGFNIALSTADPTARVTYPSDVDNYGYTAAKMNFGGAFSYGSWSENDWFMPKPCMLRSNGTVAYFLNPNDYTKKVDGTESDVANTSFDGNAMMQWPKIYVKRTEANGVYSFRISNIKVDSDYECWSNYDINNNEIPYFYTPIYFGSGSTTKMRSLSGQSNLVSTTAQQEINAAKANGANMWYTEVLSDRMLFIDLCIMLGKNCNAQAVFGQGRVGSSSATNTGGMNTKGLFWGGNPDETGVKVFGMEHPWGNIWRRTAGYILSSGNQYIKLTRGNKDGSTLTDYGVTASGMIALGSSAFYGSSGGYISGTITHKGGRFAENLSGSATTYDCDSAYYNQSAEQYALFGGYWGDALLAGPSFVFLALATSNASSDYGAALSCKPLA